MHLPKYLIFLRLWGSDCAEATMAVPGLSRSVSDSAKSVPLLEIGALCAPGSPGRCCPDVGLRPGGGGVSRAGQGAIL